MKNSQYTDEQIVKIVRESHEHDVQQTARKYKMSENTLTYGVARAMLTYRHLMLVKNGP